MNDYTNMLKNLAAEFRAQQRQPTHLEVQERLFQAMQQPTHNWAQAYQPESKQPKPNELLLLLCN